MVRAVVLAALVAIPFAATPAAGPFQVRRATSGQGVQSAPPVATIGTSPFDSDPASMQSLTSYYFGVYDAAGTALQISVLRNAVTNTLRISFDDGNAASAPVSAASSGVSVAPASINADGLQTAVITIVPRDASGVILGLGLSVVIDASLLWPAHRTGAISDVGDGSYRATAVAPVAGTGTVRVAVEGVTLSPLPTITATAVDPAASLRDLAIQQLQSLSGPGGPLAALGSGAAANSPQALAIADAVNRANAALQSLANNDPSRDDNVLKTDFDDILGVLEGVLASPGALSSLDVRDAMDDLVGIARLIARWHLERATAACGVCDGSGNPRKVCEAVDAMADADAMRAAVNPDWGGIVDTYARAVQRALQAQNHC